MPQSDSRDDTGATQSADELLRRLTGSLAHNLNNRLTVVIGALELVLQETAPDSPQAPRLKEGLRSAWQAAEMVRRMIMFAFRPSGLPTGGAIALGEVAENLGRRIREQQRPGLTVLVIHGTTTPTRANPLLVQLALEQLTANAMEAMPSGGILTLNIHDDDGGNVCITVRDTGPGLSDQAAAHLFEPFLTTRSAGHLGLGLVLCRDLAAAMGGQLHLTWEQGKGTAARLTLPGADQPSASSPPADPPPPPPVPPETLWHVI
jgi:signal transduction histidine kinase